jgi:hypothetical protein
MSSNHEPMIPPESRDEDETPEALEGLGVAASWVEDG